MAEFTPGPWRVAGKDAEEVFGKSGLGDLAVHCDRDYRLPADVGRANARLIAAAPDLYRALQDCLDALTGEQASPSWTIGACERAREALAAARGET